MHPVFQKCIHFCNFVLNSHGDGRHFVYDVFFRCHIHVLIRLPRTWLSFKNFRRGERRSLLQSVSFHYFVVESGRRDFARETMLYMSSCHMACFYFLTLNWASKADENWNISQSCFVSCVVGMKVVMVLSQLTCTLHLATRSPDPDKAKKDW